VQTWLTIFGAGLMLATPTRAFDVLLPWLLLVATLALAFGRRAPAGAIRAGTLMLATGITAAFFVRTTLRDSTGG
jgi:hypothetical protein